MSWTTPPATAVDAVAYAFVNQFWKSVQDRWLGTGALTWPQSNFAWESGMTTGNTITSVVDNGDGTYTFTDSTASFPTNRWVGYSDPTHPWIPANYDLIVDCPTDETQVVHLPIIANTATTITCSGGALADMLTGNWLTSLSVLMGRPYHCIKQNGVWWSERWIVWPNDEELWVGSTLAAGALQPVTSLTSSGTTATATVTGHNLTTGDSVTIAGATSTNGRYNGTFSVTVVDANTITYALAGTDSSPATGTITAKCTLVGAHDASASYPANAFTGKELMVRGSDGRLKRISITSNDAQNLMFARHAYTASGQYGILATAGGKWRFYTGNDAPYSGRLFLWYGYTLTDHYYSHAPDDTVQPTPAPKQSTQISTNPPACDGTTNQTIFDVDYWTALDDTCNTPDHPYSPDMFRTLRGLQVALETVCFKYVKDVSYEGASAIPTFVPATLFEAAGVGLSWRSTVSAVPGAASLTIGALALPYSPMTVYFALLNSDNTVEHSGTATLTSAGSLTGAAFDGAGDSGFVSPGDVGKTIVIATGWPRRYPREFMYMYDKWVFIPDLTVDQTSIIYPPTNTNPGYGKWVYRPKSTKYKETTSTGFVRDSNGFRPFVTGEYARYSGDNPNDPNIHVIPGNTEISTASVGTTLQAYYTNVCEQIKAPSNESAIVASLTGTATGGSTTQLQDTSQNWWFLGTVHTETGTADGFSNTTYLEDSTKLGNAFWNGVGRHLDTDGTTNIGYRDFVVEVNVSGTWYRRIVTTQGDVSGTPDTSSTRLWFDTPLPATSLGCSYRIRDPMELNNWRGRTVTITEANGTVHANIPILYNDDNTLYFAAQSFTVTAGCKYVINANFPGGVWKWDGSQWVKPTGTDPRGGGVPWLDDQRMNLPTSITDYGRARKGDYPNLELFTDLYNTINTLKDVKWHMSWTSRANPAVAELNEDLGPLYGIDAGGLESGIPTHAIAVNGGTFGGTTYHGAKYFWTSDNYTNSLCGDPTIGCSCPGGVASCPDGIPDFQVESNGGAPFAFSYADNGIGGCHCYDYQIGRRYAYGLITDAPTIFASSTDWYCFSLAPAARPAGSSWPTGPTGVTQVLSCPHQHVFNANSDGVLYNQWHLFQSAGSSSSARRESNKLGSLTIPVDCPDPSPCTWNGSGTPPPYCDEYLGYVVTDQVAILKFAVVGGFRYY